jgi:hypothetical protein
MKLKNLNSYYPLLSFETALIRLLRMSGKLIITSLKSIFLTSLSLISNLSSRARTRDPELNSSRVLDPGSKPGMTSVCADSFLKEQQSLSPLVLRNFILSKVEGSKDRSGLKSRVRVKVFVSLFFLLSPWSWCSASLQMTAPKNITFSTVARAPYAPTPTMYVGAAPSILTLGSKADILSYKLARITVNDFIDGVASDTILQRFVPFTPATSLSSAALTPVTIDGTPAQDHPLKDPLTVIAQLSTFAGQFPVMALAKYAAAGSVAPPAFAGMYMLTDDGSGSAMIKVATPIDHAGGTIDVPPVALAASNKFVFAAVSKAATQFDDLVEPARGIAIFQQTVPGDASASAATTPDKATPGSVAQLIQLNPTNVSVPGPQALALDLTTNSNLLAFGDGTQDAIARALVGRKASMCWDEGLQRLYVGFTDVRRDDPSKIGGVLGACMVCPQNDTDGTLLQFAALPLIDGLSKDSFFSAVPAALTENSNPKHAAATVATRLADVAGSATGDKGFSVSLADLKICLKILKAANEYVRKNPVESAANLLVHLKHIGGGAGIPYAVPAHDPDRFLSDFNAVAKDGAWGAAAGGDHLYVFGIDKSIAGGPGGNTAPLLRDAIRERFVQLFKNAKIVNKAYAQGNEDNSAYTNSLDFIFGFFADGKTSRIDVDTNVVQARNDGDDSLGVSIPRLAVMNTSTGRPYLIVHSIMSTSPTSFGKTLVTEADNWIYALPLIPTAINGLDNFQGTVARVTNDSIGKIDLSPNGEYQFPQELKGMPKRFQSAVRVGGGNPVPANWVQDLFVVGDSVYITLVGEQIGQQGVFKSTAIFDEKGIIAGWTPATRVMGSVLQTFASMLDQKTGNFYSLTQTPTAGKGISGATTAQVTQWGKGTARMHGGHEKYALDAVLGGLFEAKRGGIHGLKSFDALTYGFPKKQVSMLMAYGFDNVALVKTSSSVDGSLAPITKNSLVLVPASRTDPTSEVLQNVWNFSSPALSGIGPITCCGVVHHPATAAAHGWTRFYAGGFRGLAHREVAYPAGPDHAGFLTNLANPVADFVDAGFRGQPVSAVGEAVTRDAADVITHRYLHVVTQNNVTITEIPVGAGAPQGLANVTDATVLADGTIAATSAGLQFVQADGTAGAKELVSSNVVGQILQLEVIASRDHDGLYCLPATAYVLSLGGRKQNDSVPDASAPVDGGDPFDLVPQLWRIAITRNAANTEWVGNVIDRYKTNPTLKGQPRPYVQYPELRLNFHTDGSIWFDVSSKDGANTDFMRVNSLAKSLDDLSGFASLQASLTDVMSIDRVGNFKIGIPRREAASGAWLVPGDWGLRVNE